MAMIDEQDAESNTGVSDITGMELNNVQRIANLSTHSRQDQGNIVVYAIIGIVTVAVRLHPVIADSQLYRYDPSMWLLICFR